MIFIDYPYVSELLIKSTKIFNIPIVRTRNARELLTNRSDVITISEDEACKLLSENKAPKIYCNSENSLQWIYKNLKHTHLPKLIRLCKDKYAFRKMLTPIYPEFKYKEVPLEHLKTIDVKSFGFPFVLKPKTGFASLGVYIVRNVDDWKKILETIEREMMGSERMYPTEVMDTKNFLMEQMILGTEYAVDAFFKQDGSPTIINIYGHKFRCDTDVSDRLYVVSKAIFDETSDKFMKVLDALSQLGKFRNFPMHIEFRITPEGIAIPIEANPMRFAGFCLCDLAEYAWGINPYEAYFFDRVPEWNEMFQGKEKSQFMFVLGNLSTYINPSMVQSIRYDRFKADFSWLLNLYHTDYNKYHVFALAFARIEPGNEAEMEHFLKCDMRDYLVFKKIHSIC